MKKVYPCMILLSVYCFNFISQIGCQLEKCGMKIKKEMCAQQTPVKSRPLDNSGKPIRLKLVNEVLMNSLERVTKISHEVGKGVGIF